MAQSPGPHVRTFLESKGVYQCLACGSVDLVIGPPVATPFIGDDERLQMQPGSAEGFAFIPVMCRNCAYSMFFQAAEIASYIDNISRRG